MFVEPSLIQSNRLSGKQWGLAFAADGCIAETISGHAIDGVAGGTDDVQGIGYDELQVSTGLILG